MTLQELQGKFIHGFLRRQAGQERFTGAGASRFREKQQELGVFAVLLLLLLFLLVLSFEVDPAGRNVYINQRLPRRDPKIN